MVWQAIGGPSVEAEKCRSAERAGGGSCRNYLQVPQQKMAGGTRTRIKKALRAGRPAGRAGQRPCRPRRARLTGNGAGQSPLRLLLLRRVVGEVPRLDLLDSTGNVPLQSGYLEHDQNGPLLPVRWRVGAPHCGQAGPWGTLMDSEVLPYCAISCEIYAACLPMNTSRVSCPASIMSSACSHTAVVPGSAIAAGTASISVKAASDARMERPFFTR